MKTPSEYRELTRKIAEYIVENNSTLKEAGEEFGISNSYVSRLINDWLQKENPKLFDAVKTVLKQNLHINRYNRVLVECEATNCRYNTAEKSLEIGFCNKNYIKKPVMEYQLLDGSCVDEPICGSYEYQSKGKDFYK